MSYEILKNHRAIWQRKKILRRIYTGWYNLILNHVTIPGPNLEIGGGGGNFKEFFPELITSDYTYCPWLDLNLDAHELPFRSRSLGNIFVVDVLHHLTRPTRFIEEAQRVLMKNGRLIMLEPYISSVSYLIYNYFHQEDVDFSLDVFCEDMWPEKRKTPFEGNMAIPTCIFIQDVEKFRYLFPEFKVIQTCCSDYIIYPLSGGFDHPSLIPLFSLPLLRLVERVLTPFGSFFAFRMLVILENRQ